MSSLNKVILIGRIGKDPEMKYLANGDAVCSISVATDESYKKQDGEKIEKTEWHRVTLWRKQAEFAANYLGKGRLVYIEGKIQTRQYDKDGETRYATEIQAHTIQALDKKPQGDEQREEPRPAQTKKQDPRTSGPFPGDASGMDDVPFSLALVPFAGLLALAAQMAQSI